MAVGKMDTKKKERTLSDGRKISDGLCRAGDGQYRIFNYEEQTALCATRTKGWCRNCLFINHR